MNCSLCNNKSKNLTLDIDVLKFLQNNFKGNILLNELSNIKYKISKKKYKLKIIEINNNIKKYININNIFPNDIWKIIYSYINKKNNNNLLNKELDYLINKIKNIKNPKNIKINLFCHNCKIIPQYLNCIFCYNYEFVNKNRLCINCNNILNKNINNVIL